MSDIPSSPNDNRTTIEELTDEELGGFNGTDKIEQEPSLYLYGRYLERLVEIKNEYDPNGLFQLNQRVDLREEERRGGNDDSNVIQISGLHSDRDTSRKENYL